MISVEIHFYAQLRDFFGDRLSVELPDVSTAEEIRVVLMQKNPLAGDWLKVSRLAGEDAFLAEDFVVAGGGVYYLLPPSSGG